MGSFLTSGSLKGSFLIRLPYFSGDLERDSSVENSLHALGDFIVWGFQA